MNIVFDLGGVVFTWQPEAIIARAFTDSVVKELVRSKIFHHNDWNQLDRGTVLYPEATLRAAERTGLPSPMIAEFFRQVPLSLVALPDTVALLYRLKMKGHRLFCLSNMHGASFEYIKRAYNFWDVFDGEVISCLVHLVKPEPEIYVYLLEHYQLKETQTVFIDDLNGNLEPAARIGIQLYCSTIQSNVSGNWRH